MSRATVGILLQKIDSNDGFHINLAPEAVSMALERGCNLQLIYGRSPSDDPDGSEHESAIYAMFPAGSLDGLLVTNSVLHRMLPSQREILGRHLATLPLVSLSTKAGSAPCVEIDNAPGLRSLMQHLIQEHRCRTIFHVRGPETSAEAQARERVWREELLAEGITPGEDWLIPGDFDDEQEVGGLWPDDLGVPDAVVACNDSIAFRLIEEFQARGVRVPQDVIVCGFDDVPHCALSRPSLTTVRQPLELQLQTAWRLLEDQRATGQRSEPPALRTVCAVRGSCGCDDPTLTAIPSVEMIHERERLRSVDQRRLYQFGRFLRTLNGLHSQDDLPEILKRHLPSLGVAQHCFIGCCSPNGRSAPFSSERREGDVLPTAPSHFRVLSMEPLVPELLSTLVSTPALELRPWFNALGLYTVAVFPLVVGCQWFGMLWMVVQESPGFLHRLVQEHLASVLDRLHRDLQFIEAQIDEKSQGLRLNEKVSDLTRMASGFAHEVNTPLGAILSANSSLRTEIPEILSQAAGAYGQLPETGKQALERLVAKIKEQPTGRGLASSRANRLLWQHTIEQSGVDCPVGLVDDLDALGLTPNDLEAPSWLATAGARQILFLLSRLAGPLSASKVIEASCGKITEFLTFVRATVREQTPQSRTKVDLVNSVDSALTALEREIRLGVVVERDYSGQPLVWGYEAEFLQVWTNLIRNGCQAMSHQGRLSIQITNGTEWCRVAITDHGVGVRAEDRNKLFVPFYSTRRQGEGLGLGLVVAKQIITNAGGRIEFESQNAETTFRVWLASVAGDEKAAADEKG